MGNIFGNSNSNNGSPESSGLMVTFCICLVTCAAITFGFQKCSHDRVQSHQALVMKALEKKVHNDSIQWKSIREDILANQKVKKDSVLNSLSLRNEEIQHRQENFNDEMKSLLEIEYSKIQAEYETQEIWTGILTVIFLIFSFYSLLKSEQIEQQGRDTKRNIDKLYEEGNSEIKSIKERTDNKLIDIDKAFNDWKNEKDSELTSLKMDYEKTKTGLEKWKEETGKILSDGMTNWVSSYLDDLYKRIENIEKTIPLDYQKKQKEMSAVEFVTDNDEDEDNDEVADSENQQGKEAKDDNE